MLEEFKKLTGYDWTKGYFIFQAINDKRNYSRVNFNPTSTHLINHFKDNIIIALPQYPNSKILKIDIDHRSNKQFSTTKIVDKIIKYFKDACILEYSTYTYGYHLFFKLDKPISDNCKKEIEKYFKNKYNFNIEVKKEKENLKLPFSKFYPLLGVYDKDSRYRIFSQLSKKSNTRDTFILINHLFKNLKETKLPKEFVKFNKSGRKLKNIKVLNTEEYYKQKSLSKEELINKYGYGCGTRYRTQYKIAKYCVESGMSYNKFVEICEFCNIKNSKDMKNPIVKNKKLLEAWTFGNKIANQKKKKIIESNSVPEKYIKQNYKLSKEQEYQLETIIKIYLMKNKLFKRKKKENEFIQDCIKVYTEICGKEKYIQENSIIYEEENFQFLNNTVPFAKETFKKLAKELNIKNIVLIKKILISIGLIKEKMNNFGKSYSFLNIRYCKHFVLQVLHSIYLKSLKMKKEYFNLLDNIRRIKKTLIYANYNDNGNMIIIREKRLNVGLSPG